MPKWYICDFCGIDRKRFVDSKKIEHQRNGGTEVGILWNPHNILTKI